MCVLTDKNHFIGNVTNFFFFLLLLFNFPEQIKLNCTLYRTTFYPIYSINEKSITLYKEQQRVHCTQYHQVRAT